MQERVTKKYVVHKTEDSILDISSVTEMKSAIKTVCANYCSAIKSM